MAAPLASSIKTKNFSAKFQNILIFFSTYRRYFKHFFLLVDRTSIGIECVIIFHRFSLMYAKYFTVYFRRTIKFDARVANLMLSLSYTITGGAARHENVSAKTWRISGFADANWFWRLMVITTDLPRSYAFNKVLRPPGFLRIFFQ